MKLSTILAPLLAAKVDPEVILDAVRAWEAEQEAQEEEGREKARARWRKWKSGQTDANDSKRLQTTEPVSSPLVREPARVEDNLQTKILTGQKGKEEKDARDARSPFSEFWAIYPHKVGKRDAEAAFLKALTRADLATILDGVRRYAAKTDDRPWCNPATFLNQDRWTDMPAAQPVRQTHGPPGNGAMDAYHEIARRRGWTSDEPTSLPSDNADAQRLPAAGGGGPPGVVVELRRGPDGAFGSGNR